MNYSNFTAALDIGSAKITLTLGTRTTKGDINIIDTESSPTSYVKYGKIINEAAVAKEIQSLVLKIQQRQKATIEKVYISTSGTMLFSERISINKALGEGSIVTEEVIKSLNDNEELKQVPNKDEQVYCKPTCYRIDGEKAPAPEGMACQRIEADYLTITGNEESLDRIVSTLNQAEINIAELFLSPQAVAESTLTPEEKHNGAAAVKIGYGTSKLAVYKDSILQYAVCIPLGTKLIIEDLSRTLNISYSLAEELYMDHQFGAVCASLVEDAEMELTTKNDIKKIFPTRYIVEIIEARLEEILLNIKYQLEKSGFMYLLSEGLVLSGNVTSIKNLSYFVTLKTNLNSRIAEIRNCVSNQTDTKFTANDAEICGLLLLGQNNCKKEEKVEKTEEEETPKKENKTKEKKNLFRGMRSIFEELFEEEDTSLE